MRGVAVGKFQLGTVRLYQRKYDDALAAFDEARETFGNLGEPGSIAAAWHQIGLTHKNAGHYDAAEQAYQAALKIKVQTGNRSGESSTLDELGNLYDSMGRLEEAIRFYEQAAAIRVEFKDLAAEGRSRNNAADTLIKLRRYDEARQELLRAIECRKPFGHAAEPWKTFNILCDLERAIGNTAAASEARQKAVQAYLAYRRDGGENQTESGELVALIAQALQAGQPEEAAGLLAQLLQEKDLPGYLQALIPALQAVLNGARDPALAEDPNLDYDAAAELLLLLEALGPPPAGA